MLSGVSLSDVSPILDKVSKEENFDTYKVNVDEVEDVARRYGIMSILLLLFFLKEKKLRRMLDLWMMLS